MDWSPDFCEKRIIVLGCGNILFGDDGFGPAVIEHIDDNYSVPDDTCFVDAGTSVREILFDLILVEKKPERVIVVDAADKGRVPGEIYTIPLEGMPEKKTDVFSLHIAPSVNLLKELQDFCGIEVIVLVCQPASLPEEVSPGLSNVVREKIPEISRLIFEKYLG
ncbi:MAG: hydrogenase maturation protease [Nitrospinota bacterium]|nr:hydrogenase maturation protease [Nitrospinota bacterium]